MTRYRQVFARRQVLLPVVHAAAADQALRNARIAREAGADGVFLINHGVSWRELLEMHQAVGREFPGWWAGVNCLDLAAAEVFWAVASDVAGVWVDDAEIDERRQRQEEAERIQAARRASGWPGLYFGGVAFKYQRPVEDLARAASIAAAYMDVVTTSGPGTGQAAPREKIQAMKQALGTFPLAIASGITPDNVGDYLDVADCFLVSTGISRDFYELDPARVSALADALSGTSRRVTSVCFVCEWNEGRSVHLELATRRLLRADGSDVRVLSAGLSPGGGIGELREEFLVRTGVPRAEIHAHRSTVFSSLHAEADVVLVAELPMKARLLEGWPGLAGRVMTVRGFAAGHEPGDDTLSETEAHIEDAGGHTPERRLALYRELEQIAGQVARRLLGEERSRASRRGGPVGT